MSQKKVLKIGIDARFYGPKQKGLGRYVQKLVDNLEKATSCHSESVSFCHSESADEESRDTVTSTGSFANAQDDKSKYQFIIFLRKENWHEFNPQNRNFKKILADYPWYGIKEQILMPFKIYQSKVDLMHFPHFNVPIFCTRPFVITIHDLILKRFPTRRVSTLSPVKYWLKNLAYNMVITSAVKRAKKIIAVSEFTKKDILKYFKVKDNKVNVIYEGAPKNAEVRHLQRSDLIDEQYLLYVGNAYPHKNLERLISAFEKLNREKKDLKLVLVGELDYFYKHLQKDFAKINNIIFTDFVSDSELIDLYKNASLYIFPSLCEGFGLPPLEAMRYGLPVTSSNASCLPEVLGEAAIYFDPCNTDDIANKIKQALDNKELREKLILRGKEQIKKYSWDKMGKETIEVYNLFK